MEKRISEKKALKMLKANSFREISKDKILDFMSIIPDMDKEVAKKALDQFPHFISGTSKVLQEYKETMQKSMESEDKGFEAVIKGYQTTIDALDRMLQENDLTFEKKMRIVEEMNKLGDKMSLENDKRRNFHSGGLNSLASLCMIIIVIAASILGVKGKIQAS